MREKDMSKLRIGLASCQVEFGRMNDNQERIFAMVSEAIHHRVDVLCLSEYCFSGYQYRNEETSVHLAIVIEDHPFVQHLQAQSHRADMDIVAGVLERCQGRIFNSAVVISGGEIVGIHRKLQESGPITPGNQVSLMRTRHIPKLSCIICGDLYHTSVLSRLQTLRPQLVCIPMFRNLGRIDTCGGYAESCDTRCCDEQTMPCYVTKYMCDVEAWQGRTRWDIAAQIRHYGVESCVVNGYDVQHENGGGGALYIAASGEILAELGYGQTGLLLVDRSPFQHHCSS